MTLIADMLLVAGALGAAFYCLILSRRLNRFSNLEKGVGGAVAVLSSQVTDLTRVLREARETADHSSQQLESLTVRAEDATRKLELQLASMHDFSEMQAAAEAQARADMAARANRPEGRAAAPHSVAETSVGFGGDAAAPGTGTAGGQGPRAVRSFFKTQPVTAGAA